jgi:hypothetical protein
MVNFARRLVVGLLTCAVVATAMASAISTVARAQTSVELLGYHTVVPATWVARKPGSSMRLAEYVVPRQAGGADSAEVIVYFFGQSQGGNVKANIDRWRAQFSMPDGSPVPERIVRDSTATFPITIAEFRGTYARGIGAGSSPEDAKPNQGLLAAIAETPRGTMFIQLFGPVARVSAERETFMKFVRGLK